MDKKQSLETSPNFRSVPGTPFGVVTAENGKFFGVIGKYKVTEDYEFEDDLMKELGEITWNQIGAFCDVWFEKRVEDGLKQQDK